ncbi:uncharacterized protein A4U43_C04F790 [Asparagus officinalis]|uniref:Cupin type-1 domain-containing protein n=1 Tax=Asparagus officinalis TaxID=4686 RepID=A0A5P1EZZ3_ASPOF|nr:11S globulin seed storage protein 2-like [Asparagus officinalis]ONK70717.1 uncharacterized protein A4U43_C04F790 [Asparagus officinalis]
MAEAIGILVDLMRKIQRKEERGVLVNVEEEMRTIVPDEEQEGRDVRVNKEMGNNGNETNGEFCSIRLLQAIDRIGDADVFSKKAGWLNKITEDKLPLLRLVDLSAEKGSLQPNAFLVPHWSVNAHSIIYVTQGEGHLQVVDNQGRGVFNVNIKQGQLTVVPQYYACMIRAGSSGINWVTFMTSSQPMRTPIVGRLSTFTALPLQPMANSYRIPITQALELKFNRDHDEMLFPPTTTSYQTTE